MVIGVPMKELTTLCKSLETYFLSDKLKNNDGGINNTVLGMKFLKQTFYNVDVQKFAIG